MSLPLLRKWALCFWMAVAAPSVVFGQAAYNRIGGEYPIAGSILGDQVYPQLSIAQAGGFIVWQDNATDGEGLGVSARRLDSGLSGALSRFRVNSVGAGDQEVPQIAALSGGGVVFVWQGGKQGFQHIIARFRSADDTWLTDDVMVNTYVGGFQQAPAVTSLANGNVLFTWSSFNQAGTESLQDIYGQLFSAAGEKLGGEISFNQFKSYSQRDPAIAALSNGGFVAVWISEQQRSQESNSATLSPVTHDVASVDVYARVFAANGSPLGAEFLVNSSSNLCANPKVAAGSNGGFVVVWSERDRAVSDNSWDVWGRVYGGNLQPGTVRCLNTTRYGDQLLPSAAFDGNNFMVVWTSFGQDGSREGVVGQVLNPDGSLLGEELKINTSWVNAQIHPTVASDGKGRFLVAWTSYVGGATSFDLFAQRFGGVDQPLPPMDAPFVYAPAIVQSGVYQPQLQVSWPTQEGYDIDHYEVFVDDAATAGGSVSTNLWLMTSADGLKPSSTHSFRVGYVTTTGRHSPLSAATTKSTWTGYFWGDIPFEWMSEHYGVNMATWPSANKTVEPGGPTIADVFLTGGDPLKSSTWLRSKLEGTAQGFILKWNTQPGIAYQVQVSTNLSTWSDLGQPHLAAGSEDSALVGLSSAGYYRVVRLR